LCEKNTDDGPTRGGRRALDQEFAVRPSEFRGGGSTVRLVTLGNERRAMRNPSDVRAKPTAMTRDP
jgi:hypothetical protein